MKKFKYLIKVESSANANKYYRMEENDDGTFTATYARVGAEHPATEIYPMEKWDKKLNEKLSSRKGYQDQTELFGEIKSATKAMGKVADDTEVANLIIKLQGYAQANTAATYLVKAESVTQAQIKKAQEHIDTLVAMFKNHFGKSFNFDMFNQELVKLFLVIPRKMREVGEQLIYEHEGYFDRKEKKWVADKKKNVSELKSEIEKLINDEQSNLDTMASQVVATPKDDGGDSSSSTLIGSLGLHVLPVLDKNEMKKIQEYAQEHAKRVERVFKVKNTHTQAEFDKWLAKVDNKKTELFWHGSRNQNWWWIVQQGLKIRPSNAVHTGSMFGDGIYYASECDKSMGYTDSGRWARGKSDGKIYMALYRVHIGKQYVTESSDSSLNARKLDEKGYHSTWGKKGRQLLRNEYIVYRSCQSTIEYLVEFKDQNHY